MGNLPIGLPIGSLSICQPIGLPHKKLLPGGVPEKGIPEGIPSGARLLVSKTETTGFAAGARLEGREGQRGLLQTNPPQRVINLFLRALWRVCAWNQAVRQTRFPNTALVAVYLTMIYGC